MTPHFSKEQLDAIFQEATQQFRKTINVSECSVMDYAAWVQTWPATLYGFERRPLRQRPVSGWTVVVQFLNKALAVFHDLRFAYIVSRPSANMVKDILNHGLKGALAYTHGGKLYEQRRGGYETPLLSEILRTWDPTTGSDDPSDEVPFNNTETRVATVEGKK